MILMFKKGRMAHYAYGDEQKCLTSRHAMDLGSQGNIFYINLTVRYTSFTQMIKCYLLDIT